MSADQTSITACAATGRRSSTITRVVNLGVCLCDDEAEEIARDFLIERHWFAAAGPRVKAARRDYVSSRRILRRLA